MHQDVAALLAVQDDDVSIHDLETQLAALKPRLEAMARDRDQALAALQQAKQAAESEEKRRREVAERVAQHKALYEKNQAALNNIASMREATAATAQLEAARRMIDEDERELAAIGQRLQEGNRLVQERERIAQEMETAQTEARSTLSADQERIETQLNAARGVRNEKAKTVPRSLLSQYERIAKKRVNALFPVRGSSCANCDTVLPMQRRNAMTGSNRTEICEECGVMLYAAE